MTPPMDENTIALFKAIETKEPKRVLEALKSGADANARDGWGTAALKYAMAFGDVETAKTLIAHGAKVKDQDILPELAAYGRGGAEMARLLLKAGANVDERTGSGYTPLLIAAGRGVYGYRQSPAGGRCGCACGGRQQAESERLGL
ncbi:MAG: ankyrin repeat domain-containing protein [Chloroflexi bacterium]|nr:ankyrin repeat domain-containing protein [Chloroflexota bacterium]